MNWLERARREIGGNIRRLTAVTAKGNAAAAMAVLHQASEGVPKASNGSNGSAPVALILDTDAMREDFEERAAIMEFDGGLSRDEAERRARSLATERYRLH